MVRTRNIVVALLLALLAIAGCTAPEADQTARFQTPAGQAGGEQVEPPRQPPAEEQSATAPARQPRQEGQQAAPPQQPVPPKEPPATAVVPPPAREDAPSSPAGFSVRKTTGSDSIALTFDDGPSPFTAPILALLRQQGVKATFCLVGARVAVRPELVRRIVADGHTLCNHTWSHDLKLGTNPTDEIREDLARTNAEIRRAAPGASIKYFRHPGGNFTPRAVSVARQLGMTSIAWNVDPEDWDTKTHPAGPEMADHIVKFLQGNARPGAIVLAHDGGGDRSGTVAACRRLLPLLKEQYTLAALPR